MQELAEVLCDVPHTKAEEKEEEQEDEQGSPPVSLMSKTHQQRVSVSEAKRLEGNEHYEVALSSSDASISVRLINFSDAIKLYQEAFDAALDDKDRAFAAGNIGSANRKAAELLMPGGRSDWQGRRQELDKCLKFTREAHHFFLEAASLGMAAGLDQTWQVITRKLLDELQDDFLPKLLASVGASDAEALTRAVAAPGCCPKTFQEMLLQRASKLRSDEGVAEAELCCVCMVKRKNTVLLPCKHMCLCDSYYSARNIAECPLCRNKVRGAVDGIFS